MSKQLTQTVPTRNARVRVFAVSIFFVNTPAAKQYRVAFARFITSSKVLHKIAANSVPPKIQLVLTQNSNIHCEINIFKINSAITYTYLNFIIDCTGPNISSVAMDMSSCFCYTHTGNISTATPFMLTLTPITCV